MTNSHEILMNTFEAIVKRDDIEKLELLKRKRDAIEKEELLRYRKALQRIVDSGDNMAEGIYLGAASCYRIAKDALDNTNTFPEQT